MEAFTDVEVLVLTASGVDKGFIWAANTVIVDQLVKRGFIRTESQSFADGRIEVTPLGLTDKGDRAVLQIEQTSVA